MKKLFLSILALTLLVGATNAQTPADLIKAAKKAVNNISGKEEKIAAAQTAVDAMMNATENQTNWEALLTKGKFYNEQSVVDNAARLTANVTRKQVKSKFTKSALMASDALLAAMKATQDKKQIKEIITALSETQGAVNNYGSEMTDAKDYVGAYTSFKTTLDIHDILKANGGKSTLDKVEEYNKQLYLVGLLSTYAEKEKESIPLYEKMIAAKKDTSFVYSALYKATIDKDKAAAIKWLEEGRRKFPEDNQLLFAEINYYLKEGKLEQLIDKLKEGITKEPKNASLTFTLGNVYDNLSQNEKDAEKSKMYAEQSIVYYNKTLEIDPKNVDATYSIGASFYNKAAAYSKQMKALESDFSKEGQKKYEAAEKLMLGEFDKALPFFQKAESMNANDQNTLIALKEIFARKNDLKTSAEFKQRYENVVAGGKNATSYFKQ